LAIAFPKATLTRAELMVNVSPSEPEPSGRLVMQIGNLPPLQNRIYIDEGIAQIIFFGASDSCDVYY
jgi:dCTP deaminase